MGLLLFIGIFLFCAVMAQMRDPISRSGSQVQTSLCPPHKWDYRKERDGVERLCCKICNGKPGYTSRE